MSTALRQIEQEITEIETSIDSTATKIQSTYLEYAEAVAQAVQQQVIIAMYQVCTRDRPAAFLTLSFDRRHKLQQDVQILAKTTVDLVRQSLAECVQNLQSDQEAVDRLLTKTLSEASQTANDLLITANILDSSTKETVTEIQIRLSEVEFTNRTVMSHRGELRVLSARLNQLHSELERKQKLKMIAEAELTWRSSWTELD